MKKLLIVSNLIFLTILVFLLIEGCKPSNNNCEREGDIIMNYKDSTFNSLPVVDARNLFSNYVEKRIPMVNQVEGIKDAESVWFSLDEIKQLAYITEYYTKQSNVGVSNKDLGIRVYYGKYETGENNVQIKKEYNGLHTVFMVPTYKKGGEDIDFDPKESYARIKDKSSKNLISLNIDTRKNIRAMKLMEKANPIEASGVILNHGNLCPPCIRE